MKRRFCRLLATVSVFAILVLPATGIAEIRILFLGDTHSGENYQENYDPNILETEGYQYGFANYTSQLVAADEVIANLETPISDLETSPFEGIKSYLHWTDPVQAPATLLANNITAFSLANNHTLDYGFGGLTETLDVADDEGLTVFGAGADIDAAEAPYVQQYQVGSRIFTLGVIGSFEYRQNYDEDYDFYADETTPGTNTLSASAIAAQVTTLRATYPDIFIVAFPHWGDNYYWKTEEQTSMAYDLIDAGADMIIGHGAHTIQEVERYRGKWIVYSIGNFVFGSAGRYDENEAPPYGFILELSLIDAPLNLDSAFRLYPIFTDNQITNFQGDYVTATEFADVESLMLSHGGTENWGDVYSEGQDQAGRRYLEFPMKIGRNETEISFDDFGTGTSGNYVLGSTYDAELKTTSSFCRDPACIRLEDDEGIASSFYTEDTFDASGYDWIEIDYWMRARWGDNGDSYHVKYWDGATWHTVATFVNGVDYDHDDAQYKTVVIDSCTYTMSSAAKIRFESDGTDDSVDVYFDEIRVAGNKMSVGFTYCSYKDGAYLTSFRSSTTVPGVGTAQDEDIVAYLEGGGEWEMVFDGSDVGLGGSEITGMAVLPDGDLLLSFRAAATIGGLSVDDSDIVRFTPTSLGSTTAGTFAMYFDGSDVGLDTNNVDIDAIALAPDGRLVISTNGDSLSAQNIISGRDEALWIFSGTLGSSTSGSFVKYFDGSDVGLADTSGEDVDAASFTSDGNLVFSTVGDFSVTGVNGQDEDLVEFSGTFGTSTSGIFSMRQALDSLGIDVGEDVGSLHVFNPQP